MNKVASYLIMAGGTGGHIFPALAVARSLIERGANVNWLGTEMGMESRLVPEDNICLHAVNIKGFRGKGIYSKLLTPFLLINAVYQSIKIINKIKPDVVIGFGGYVSAPGGIAARLTRKQLIVHEQNSVAGSTNKLLSKISNINLEAFPKSLLNAERVGNPVRKEIKQLFSESKNRQAEDKKKVLIMGGSLGAEALNNILPQVIEGFNNNERPLIWHQTGKNKQSDVERSYKAVSVDARVDEFISNVADAYKWADIIVCRAGALTVSEISVAGVPAIFIPYPYAIDNHQYFNAKWLVDNQAAFLIEQSTLSVETLSVELTKMIKDESLLISMTKNLKKLAIPDATNKVVKVCEEAYFQKCLGDNNNAA